MSIRLPETLQPADRISSESKKRPFGEIGPSFEPSSQAAVPNFSQLPQFNPTSTQTYDPSSSVIRTTKKEFGTTVIVRTKYSRLVLPKDPMTMKQQVMFLHNNSKLPITHINYVMAETMSPQMTFQWVLANVTCYGVLRNDEESALANSGPRFWDQNLPKNDWTADALEIEGYTTTKNIWPSYTGLNPGTFLGFMLVKRRVSSEVYTLHNGTTKRIPFSNSISSAFAWQFIPVAVQKITKKLLEDYVAKHYSHYDIDLGSDWAFIRFALLKEQKFGGVMGTDTNWDKMVQSGNIPVHVMSPEVYSKDILGHKK
jgi:hypothetical protein